MARALDLYKAGDLAGAERQCASILQANPDDADALQLTAIISARTGRLQEAENFLRRALATRPDDPMLHSNLGNVQREQKNPQMALVSYERALQLNPGYAEGHNNRGNALRDLDRFNEALASYERAIGLKANYVLAMFNRAVTLQDLSDFEAARDGYEEVLAAAPQFADAHNNLGAVLQELRDYERARSSYERALRLQPALVNAHLNLGRLLQGLGHLDEMMKCYLKAVKLRPDDVNARVNLGNALRNQGRVEEADRHFQRAMQLRPDHPWLLGMHLYTRMLLCDWSQWEDSAAVLATRVGEGGQAAPPFAVLAVFDDPDLHQRASRIWTKHRFQRGNLLGPIAPRGVHDRIRIGYFSADFHDHATSRLAAGLFERHDRRRFELFAFSYGPDRQDPMRARIRAAFDQFLDVRNQSDLQIARLSRELEIDIAVDLKGHAHEQRTGVFAQRAAPIQVNYLGYPGTMGADYMDYLVADREVVPPELKQHYDERIVWLPNCYQVNDRQRPYPSHPMTRGEVGLAKTGAVFCCFNNPYKITPRVFDVWMKILLRTPGSQLWLLEDHAATADNLRRETRARGVDPARLVFAKRLPLQQHLSRHRLADLFLDTFPCNAHTTASDALWSGLPVLTLRGRSFAGCVGASLLRAVAMPELVVDTERDYEELAVQLIKDPARIAVYKKSLDAHREEFPLFDTDAYAENLEAAYVEMYRRWLSSADPLANSIGD